MGAVRVELGRVHSSRVQCHDGFIVVESSATMGTVRVLFEIGFDA